MTIRVLIADDQDIIRGGLKMILNGQPDIDVVAEADNGREAVHLARKLRPDVCLFDIRMPIMEGIEATRQLAGRDVDDPLAIIIITTYDLDEHVHDAPCCGSACLSLRITGPCSFPVLCRRVDHDPERRAVDQGAVTRPTHIFRLSPSYVVTKIVSPWTMEPAPPGPAGGLMSNWISSQTRPSFDTRRPPVS